MKHTPLTRWMAAASSAFAVAGLLTVAPVYAADQVRELPVFTSITSQGAFSLVVHAGQKQSVTLSGSETALAKIETSVVDGVLTVSMAGNTRFSNDEKLSRITIQVERLSQFQMEGAGKTELNNLSGDRFRLNYQGVGLLRATGKVQTFVLQAEGVGSVNARELEAQHVDVNLQGVGSVQVRAKESLRAKVDGIGSLTYYGKPTRISKTVEGIGSISAAE